MIIFSEIKPSYIPDKEKEEEEKVYAGNMVENNRPSSEEATHCSRFSNVVVNKTA